MSEPLQHKEIELKVRAKLYVLPQDKPGFRMDIIKDDLAGSLFVVESGNAALAVTAHDIADSFRSAAAIDQPSE